MESSMSNVNLLTPGALWQDDTNVFACSGRRCGRRFNRLFCPKHHCRWCGRVYCDACAPKQTMHNGQLVRKCNRCRLPVVFRHSWNERTRMMDCTPFECIISYLTPRSITALLQSCHTMMSEFPVCGYPFYDSIQQRFPSFYPGAQIGRGTFGTVFKCEDRTTADHKRAILKCINKATNLTYTRWMGALTELRILESVNHPNVAHLLGAFQTREDLVIVMEAGEGGTARRAAASVREYGQAAEEAFTANIMEGVAAGLDYLYREKHIIHRDIKLDNIVLSADYSTPMIIDFGLAEFILNEEGQWYVVGGTRNYAAPESIAAVANGHVHMKEPGITMHKGDLFSLGVVAYYLLSGHRPFRSRSFDKMHEEMRCGVSCTGPLWDGISSDARELVQALLSYDPAQRPDYAAIKENPFITARTAGVKSIQLQRNARLLVDEEETHAEWVTLELSDLREATDEGESEVLLPLSTPQRWYHAYLPRFSLLGL
ncbi:protein kinase, putative [Leishmania tarentolae]|uniref:Protein kinase, putative n=1 Tax=Leishmania tarentolae TaxID=5689 RepID=A0A640KQ13_LEITA|nr:protein kinase, putative [Leishmania tarentolae]